MRVYESTDGTLDIPGDTQMGSLSTVNLRGNMSISVSTSVIRNTNEYFYFGDEAGGLDLTAVTTAGTLSADVIATEIIYTQKPSVAENDGALSTRPTVTTRDANGTTDTDFTDTVTLTSSGSGSLANSSLSESSGVATST
ncbi:TPA: hypothetical protein DCE37_14705 [Candidatus Latescibacteria bacterium]|nr:hypothetical protein [Candidatus Latescibacterota bacterium]